LAPVVGDVRILLKMSGSLCKGRLFNKLFQLILYRYVGIIHFYIFFFIYRCISSECDIL
jgi:hypothetical protein